METIREPGSRADLLLTLTRMALPDALRRSEPGLAPAILLGGLFLVFATAATLVALPAIFAIESEALRRNLLSLIACSVTALALAAQVVLRAPFTWLLDLEGFLRLPAGFRELYGLRFGLSTIGFWVPILGPTAVYLAVMRSGGASGAPVTVLGILGLVWIYGRLAAILSLLVSRHSEGVLGTLVMMAIMVVLLLALLAGVGAMVGELDSQGLTRTIERSALLGSLSYTPPGLLAGIVVEPGVSAPNLARLGALMAVLGSLALLEHRLLLRHYLECPGGDRRTASGTLPVAWLMRKADRLTGIRVLALLETECLLRLKPARFVLAMAIGYALVFVPIFAGSVVLVAVLALALHEFRIAKQPPTCHAWRESLTLPLSVQEIFRATGRGPNVLAVFVIALLLGLTPFDWYGWPPFLVASCAVLASLLNATPRYGLLQLRWPQRNDGFWKDPDITKFGAAAVVANVVLGPCMLSFILIALHQGQRISSTTALLIAAAMLLVAVAAAWSARRQLARKLETRGPELLLEVPPN